MKKLVCIFVFIIFINSLTFANDSENIFELIDNSYENIYKGALKLQTRYPEIIKVETIGYSTDGRVIFVVKMSNDVVKTFESANVYVNKMHFLVESGIHSRENPGPNIVMKTIENYAELYYKNDNSNMELFGGYDIKQILNISVIHFIPLSNPDGYELSRVGITSVSKKYSDYIETFENQNFKEYKSNIRGVDLNRNFPGIYYNIYSRDWTDIWNVIKNINISDEPSDAFYPGSESNSENETKILSNYLLKYDFRNYLSYHSKGNIIFWDMWMLSNSYNYQVKKFAVLANIITGYEILFSTKSSSSSGYMSDFISMNTLKPAITIELGEEDKELPFDSFEFLTLYEDVWKLPLEFASLSIKEGYYPYRWYNNSFYIRDFYDKIYAESFALKYGGFIIEDIGKPDLYINKENFYITKLDTIGLMINIVSLDIDKILYEWLWCQK